MILLDANVLLYAYDSSSRSHARCRDWLEAALNGEDPVALPWQTLLAFVRIATNGRAFQRPLDIDVAVELVEAWLSRPHVMVPNAGAGYWPLLKQQLLAVRVTGPLVSDAALAALAMEYGATLATTDRDFRRFDGLKLLDPTA